MVQPSNRWNQFGTSIFTRMTQAANEAGTVNLVQGFPDFDGPISIKESAIQAIRGFHNQYSPFCVFLPVRLPLEKCSIVEVP